MVSRFLLCLLVGSALAGSLQEAEVPRDWTSQYQQSRTSWRGLRIHVYYNDTLVDSSAMNTLKTEVMPRVLRWYEHVLQVPPISTTIKVPSKYCVQSLVPTSHNVTGVEADMVLYVVTPPSWSYSFGLRSIFGAPCLVSGSAPQRALAGNIVLVMDWFNQMSLETKIQVVTQAIAQTLAFNGLLYPYFSKPDGSPYHISEVLKFETLGGVGAYFMILPTVLKRARAAFACPTLPGVRFGEYSSSNEYFASVWSARMMMDDFMSNKVVNRPSYSDVTMAVFEDSGWYEVQWEYTNPVQFLYHQGCAAFSTACISNGAATRKEFCVESDNGCGATSNTIGFCQTTTWWSEIPAPFAYFTDQKKGGDREMDYCPVISGYQTCLEGSGPSGEEKCSECRCIAGSYQSTLTHCFRITCVQGQATVNVGSQTLSCPTAGGVVTIPGNLGQLTCPASDVLCNIAPCKNLCSGYGRCQRSGCVCEKGYSGSDCSITCDVSCDQCSGSGSQACTSCRPGASLSNGACVCNQGLTMNAAGYCIASVSCHATCLTCSGALATQCTSCQYPARVGTSGACECPEGSTLSTTGTCLECAATCKTCAATSLSVCLSCYGAIVLNNGICTCSTGNYFDLDLYYCQSCDTSCSTCSGNVSNCISCPNGQVLSDGKCACSTGYFISGSSCSQCHANCLSCRDSTEKGCLSCRSEAYLLSIPGPCLCRPSSTSNCSQCLPQCQTCDGPGLLTCASCFSNAGVNPFTKLCKCNDGYYPSPDEANCVVCHPLCRTCFGGSSKNCITCSENSVLYMNECSCRYGYYFDQTLRMCKSCPENCSSCLGGTTCSYCNYGTSKDANGVCVLQNGYGIEPISKQTYSCPSLCKHCTIQANPIVILCTECYGSIVPNAITNACQCAPGNYYESALQQCVGCADSKCLQCTSSGNCQLCEAPFIAQNNSYLCGCSSGGYRSGTTCQPCHAHCRACRGPTSGDCMSCFDNAYLSGDLVGICLCRAGSGQTLCDELVCDSTCATCSGSDYNDCLSCQSSGRLESGTCPCYPSLTVGSNCRHCPGSCLECNTSGGCVSCSHSKAYIPANRPGECVCRGYPDPTPANCSPCHFTCKECSGPAENQCTACGYDATLQSSGKCQCPGLRQIAPSGDCFISNSLCEDAFCTKCKGLATNTNSFIGINGVMYPFCSCYFPQTSSFLSLSFVNNMNLGTCVACGLLCNDCSLVTNMCSSCKAHSTLVILAPALNMGYCECQSGYYERNGDCLRCGEGCVSCSSLSKCNKCVVGYELKVSGQQSTCQAFKPINGCPQGLYLLRQTGLCEAICPTGFTPANGECNESSQTRFVWQFDQFPSRFNDSTGNYSLEGAFDAYPLYKRGLRIVSNYTNLSHTSIKLVLAPTFYIEVWLRGAYIGFGRGSPKSSFYFSENSLTYWSANFRLIDVSGNYYNTYPSSNPSYSSNPPPPPSEWRRIRLELITTTEGRDIITKYRLSKNDQIIGESIIRNYYFRDGPMDAVSSSLSLNIYYVGAETYLAEFTVANRLWKAEANACGCPLCTSNGFCLSNCAFNQYPSESSCLPCSASCTKGCLRGTDCGLNFDPLCTKFSNFTSCQGCHSLAERKGGVCSCQANAKFQTSSGTCVCNDDSKLNPSGFCAKCLNYLRADDVSVDIDESFMSLTLTFKKPMTVASGNCNDLFSSETIAKFGTGATCSWTPNRKQLTVLFGSEATLVVEEIDLNYESLLSSEGPCSFDAVKLRPKANYKGNTPVPVPSLTVPTTIALACDVSSKRPIVSAKGTGGGKGRKLLYKWAFTHSKTGAVLTNHDVYSEESSISPAFETLPAGTLTVTVTVKNSFQKEASSSAAIQLTETRALTVQFDTGPQLILTSQDQGQVRVLVTESCGVSTATRSFQWDFLSASPALASSDTSPSQILQASKSPAVLFIKKNALATGRSYIFKATVTQGVIEGSAALNVTVVSSKLIARLNRISGYHPNDMTLRLDATLSTDPDTSPEPMVYMWNCTEGTDVCKDSSGATLLQNVTTDVQLFLPARLRQGAVYNFTLTVSKDSRKASSSVIITIILPTGCNIVLKPLVNVINSGWPFSLVAGITTDLEVEFLWRQTGGPTAQPTGAFTFAYLSFSEDTLQGGQNYGFELTAKTAKGNIIAPFEFYINRGPVGGKTVVTPSTGRALLDNFLLTTEGWEDAEGNYPLSYQFCLSKGSSTPVCVGALSLKLWTYMKLYPGDLTVTAKVFDYYGAQSISTTQVTVSTAARRQLQDLTASFQADIEEAENTCGMIVVYCQSIQVSETLYTIMVGSLKIYIQSLNQIDVKSMESILGAVEALAGEPPTQLSNNAIELLSILKSVASTCVDSLTLSSTQRALAITSKFSNSTSDITRLAAADTASAILAIYTRPRLPNEAPTSYFSQLLLSYVSRITGNVLGNLTVSLGNNATVVAPTGWLNGTKVASTDIIDVYARSYLLNSSFAWVVDLTLQQVGSYASYSVALTTPVTLKLSKLAVPINVTIPFTKLPANSTFECIALVGTQWMNVCDILEIRSGSVVVSSIYLAPLSVRAVLIPQNTTQPPTTLDVLSNSNPDCNLNPAPLSIACAAFLLGLFGFVLLKLVKKTKNGQAVPTARSGEAWVTSLGQNNPETVDLKETPVPLATVSNGGMLRFHLLLGCIFYSEMRLRKLWTLVSTLEVEALILGLCYSFWDDNGDHADNANDVFSTYSGEDLAYVAISLAVGGVYCGVLQVSRMHPVPSAVATVLALGGILYLNVDQCCYSEGGRWGEGLLWTLLLQLVLLETVKAGVMLLWARRRASAS